jgi:predicted ATP-dependent endonuclease of OLD family
MIEIEVNDFQSISHTAVTIDKFSVIVGRSNIGKSALVRAIQCALTGAVGTDFVRHGATCDRTEAPLRS